MRWTNVVAWVVGIGLSPFLDDAPSEAASPTTIQMDFTRVGGFFSAPFPNEDRRAADGHVDLSGFPSRGTTPIVDAALSQIEADARGFSTTAGIFFSATKALDPASLPATAKASLAADATVYLIDVARGERTPVDVAVLDDGGRFGAPNLLSLVPYQGVPLRPSTLYAAVVTTGVRDQRGRPIVPAEAIGLLRRGGVLPGLPPQARALMVQALKQAGGAAAIAVFRTDAPRAGMEAVRDAMLREHPAPNAPLAHTESYADFCVYQSTIDLPQYQAGTPPFATEGGKWVFDRAGRPVRQRVDRAGLTVTLPRAPMPPGGYPTVVFSRTGAGGDRALVDHGFSRLMGDWKRGSGPALEFARAGFAAIMVDGPLGGLRNPDHADEQFLIFNGTNPGAIRDNIRQSAAELILTAHVVDDVTVDATPCGGDARARLDPAKLALFGHSMGATFAPLALAYEPRFKAAILSGAGGSYLANLLHKQKPVPVRRIAEWMFGYTFRLFSLTQGDPALSIVQWAVEPADPPVYGGLSQSHVLMFQGIADHYILPPMANAASLSLGLDLAGAEGDRASDELSGFAPFGDVAAFAGRGVKAYPVEANVNGRVTAAVVQRAGDGLQDAHEIVFQTAGPKYQYRCFLKTFAASGTPRIVAPKEIPGVCD